MHFRGKLSNMDNTDIHEEDVRKCKCGGNIVVMSEGSHYDSYGVVYYDECEKCGKEP